MNLSAQLEAVTAVQPRILILDDEFAQRAGICLQLGSVGFFEFIEFDDPRPALEFLREHHVDLVIVDIRMSHLPVDGLWFMDQFRAFDAVTSIIIRTAHDDLTIADAALEARAIRRVLKSHPQASEMLRRSVTLGIVETRQRRRTQRDAAATAHTSDQMVDLLARTDDRITIADMCRSFTLGLVDQVNALAHHAELLAREDLPPSEWRERALENRELAARLGSQVAAFVRNPYVSGQADRLASARANDCLDALAASLAGNTTVRDRDLLLSISRAPDPLAFCAPPTGILTALRHLVEYCALHAQTDSRISISAELQQNLPAFLEATATGKFLLNTRAASRVNYVAFRVLAATPALTLEALRTALSTCGDDPRTANLLMLSTTVVAEHLVFETSLGDGPVAAFTLYVPAGPA